MKRAGARGGIWLVGWALWLIVCSCLPVAAEYRQSTEIAPGVTHMHLVRTAGPVEAEVLFVDLPRLTAHFEVSLAGGQVVGLRTVPDQAKDLRLAQSLPLAGINADYFFLEPLPSRGDPLGLCIRHGELISAPSERHRSAFAIVDDGRPFIGVPAWQAWVTNEQGQRWPIRDLNAVRLFDTMTLYTPTFGPSTTTDDSGTEVRLTGASLPLRPGSTQAVVETVSDGTGDSRLEANVLVLSAHGKARPFLQQLSPGTLLTITLELTDPFSRAVEAIGGGPRLLRAGQVSVEWQAEGFSPDFANDRHPRTALGIAGNSLILVAVDGRQPGYSTGMTLYELAELLRSLGASEALNLDGGGSTTFWATGRIVNSPSGDYPRAVANALFLLNPWPPGDPVRLVLSAPPASFFVGAESALDMAAWDRFGNALDAPKVQWEVAPQDTGQVSPAGVFKALKPGQATVRAQAGSATDEATVAVVDSLQGARLRPAVALLTPGESLRFLLEGLGAGEQPVLLPLGLIQWSAQGDAGELGADGEFAAGTAGQTTIAAQAAGRKATAQVVVGPQVRTLEDFEQANGWRPASYPKWTPAYFRLSSQESRHGLHAGQLRYDFSGAPATAAAYALWERDVGSPSAISAWVYGDGQRHLLRCRLLGAGGTDAAFDMAPRVDWNAEWRCVGFALPADFPRPVKLISLYVAETDPQKHGRGLIYIDDLRGLYSSAEAGPLPASPR